MTSEQFTILDRKLFNFLGRRSQRDSNEYNIQTPTIVTRNAQGTTLERL